MDDTAATAAETPQRDDGHQLVIEMGIRHFLGPVRRLLDDPAVAEIMITGTDAVYVERAGRIEKTDVAFESERALLAAVNTIAQFCGKTISDKEPILDGRLPDGSRVCVVMPPITEGGVSVNIRRFLRAAVNERFLIEKKAATEQAVEMMRIAVKAKKNIIVSGGTGSGKTTLLNILSTWFDPSQRVVIIEDTRELQMQVEHTVQMEARRADEFGEGEVTVRDLFVTSLRMRPDRIVVGEVRRGEALDMIQAMSSGHSGTLATLHADTPSQSCGRLETMCLMADLGLPLAALRRQIAMAVDLIIQTSRLPSGRRLITHISEVDYDDRANNYKLADLFALEIKGGEPELVATGRRPGFADEVSWMGLAGEVKLTKPLFEG